MRRGVALKEGGKINGFSIQFDVALEECGKSSFANAGRGCSRSINRACVDQGCVVFVI